MLTENTSARAEGEIRALAENWRKGFLARDLDTVMSCYTPDVVAFDAVLKLQFQGAQAYGKHWQACMEMCPGDLVCEFGEFAVEASDNLAFARFLFRCGGTNDKGESQSSWMRSTIGLRRVGDQWKIAHEHISMPFDPMSGKVLFDATPE